MKISVVIPTRNRAQSLRDTLSSFVVQTLDARNYELIIVDDGSTDDTPEIVKHFEDKVYLKYIQQRNAGPATARNRGAELARFPFILFFDDDVVADKDLLQSHLDEHLRYGSCSILGYTPFARELPDTPVMQYHRQRWDNIFADARRDQQKQGRLTFSHFITINLSVRKEDFDQVGPFNQDISVAAFEDTELGRRFSEAGIPHRFCERAHATHYPQLDITSLVQRRYSFGRVAANYYLNHPDDADMHRCMNVDYIFPNPSKLPLAQRLRRSIGQFTLMTNLGAEIAATVGQFRLAPRGVRLSLLRVVSTYWYRRGFIDAIAEQIRGK